MTSLNGKGERTMLKGFMKFTRNGEAHVMRESCSSVYCQREFAGVSEARRMSLEKAHNSAWCQKS